MPFPREFAASATILICRATFLKLVPDYRIGFEPLAVVIDQLAQGRNADAPLRGERGEMQAARLAAVVKLMAEDRPEASAGILFLDQPPQSFDVGFFHAADCIAGVRPVPMRFSTAA